MKKGQRKKDKVIRAGISLHPAVLGWADDLVIAHKFKSRTAFIEYLIRMAKENHEAKTISIAKKNRGNKASGDDQIRLKG